MNPDPKIELHVHLEGAMRPSVLLELARRSGIELPARDGTASPLSPVHFVKLLKSFTNDGR